VYNKINGGKEMKKAPKRIRTTQEILNPPYQLDPEAVNRIIRKINKK
jgi:hypothetical protein